MSKPGKIIRIEENIEKCEKYLYMSSGINFEEIENFIYRIARTYHHEIDGISSVTDMLDNHTCFTDVLEQLSDMLLNYKDNIELEYEKRKDELEIARLKNPSLNLTQTQNNHQSQNIKVTVTLEQVNKIVNKIPESLLPEEEKERFLGKLASFDNATKTKEKDKIWDKAKEILAYIGDKGVDTGIALIPLLPFIQQEMAKIQF